MAFLYGLSLFRRHLEGRNALILKILAGARHPSSVRCWNSFHDR